MNDLAKLALSVFCMVVWGLLAATVASVLVAVLVESCGAGHTATVAALVVAFAGTFSAVCWLWNLD